MVENGHNPYGAGQPADDGAGRTSVGIIGLGLIGGSLALALGRTAGFRVVGLDRKRRVIDAALADGALAAAALLPDLPELPGCPGILADPDSPGFPQPTPDEEAAWRLLADCAVVFVCTPPSTVPAYVKMAARYCPGILTDVASVKGPIMESVKLGRFIGGHPMAGSEQAGYVHASDKLLENAIYVVCLPADHSLTDEQISFFEQLVRLCGAVPFRMGAAEHDKAVALVSHLPHVAAAGLALLASLADTGTPASLAAGGFRDLTRIASSDPGLWAGISLENAGELLPAIDRYIELLGRFRADLARGNCPALQDFFSRAAEYRGSLPPGGQKRRDGERSDQP